MADEASIQHSISQARAHFGPIHICCPNAGITDESNEYPAWRMPTELWDKTYAVNVRGTFLTIKHFLASAEASQQELGGQDLPNLAIVLTGSECGKFGQAGHAEYASGKAALQYGLVRTLKNEIVRLNAKARINAVAPGWVDTPLIEGRLDDTREMWREAQATVPLRKIATPEDVARAVVFLASHRAAGHITGECISVDGGMEGRIVWSEDEVLGKSRQQGEEGLDEPSAASIPQTVSSRPKNTIKIALSIDFDAVSGWLGTGAHPDNNLSDLSSGFFSAQVGVGRLLKLFKRLSISDKVTWFCPGHSLESFPEQTRAILDSGCELGLHGYCHEGAPQLTEPQEREVIEKCVELATSLTGKKPVGYRAPLYQLRESTISLLEEHGFLYDTSLAHHDSTPYYVPQRPPVKAPSYGADASAKDWMHPLPEALPPSSKTLVEIPCNWYMEDMTPMQFWPHTDNSHGYVDSRVIERMWMDRFEFLRSEMEDEGEGEMTIFPLVLHPDTSGMAHVLPMIERFLRWVQARSGEVEFMTYTQIAETWKADHKT